MFARLLAVALLIPAALACAAGKPNILWISCEDMSPDLALYGDPLGHAPNLQKLADGGVVFTRAFSTAPVCSASRSSIITGMYSTSVGTHQHRSKIELPSHIRTFPTYLRQAGYYTTNNSKTDYNFDGPPGTWDDNSSKAHWRNRPDKAQPFFSVFNFTVTHESHSFKPDDYSDVPDVPAERRTKPASVKLPPYIPDTPLARQTWAHYYDTIQQMDIQAGRVLDELEQDGLTTNTLVVFFSDHGMGLPRGKRWLWDSGMRVALVANWPGKLEAGSKNDELASLLDLPPTMLSAAGVAVPGYMQGRVLWGAAAQPEPQYLYGTRDRMDEVHDMMRSVRSRDFKFIRNFYPERPYATPIDYMDKNPLLQQMRQMDKDGTLSGPATLFFAKQKPREEFYDLRQDPYELTNLVESADYATTVAAMRDELAAWQKRTGDKGYEPDPGNPDKAERKPQRKKHRNKAE